MDIKKIDCDFSVCKLKDLTAVDFEDEFCFTGKTDEEYSLVCMTQNIPENVICREDGWKAFRIEGILDFSLIGILAEISALLSENQIGIFVVSTFNTDYIFMKSEHFARALDILADAGHQIIC